MGHIRMWQTEDGSNNLSGLFFYQKQVPHGPIPQICETFRVVWQSRECLNLELIPFLCCCCWSSKRQRAKKEFRFYIKMRRQNKLLKMWSWSFLWKPARCNPRGAGSKGLERSAAWFGLLYLLSQPKLRAAAGARTLWHRDTHGSEPHAHNCL